MTARIQRDIEFADSLFLDLYLPGGDAEQVPVVVYLHGGGWTMGDRTLGAQARGDALAAHGMAMASVGYRLAPAHHYPAQLQDAQTAVRWLRANGDQHGLKTDRIGAWGISAGGQLAGMLGLTTDDAAAAVQAVACYFPTVDLLAAGVRTGLEQLAVADKSAATYLGLANVSDDAEFAKAASPRYHVSAEAPPFLLVHGDRDQMVSADQSRWLHDALVAAGASSHLVMVGGAGHEDDLLERPALLGYVAGFFAEHLA